MADLLYQIGAVTFQNAEPGNAFDQWFVPAAVYNTEVILDGGGALYTDVGEKAAYTQTREYKAACASEADRTAIILLQGTKQTFKRLGTRMPMTRTVLVATAAPFFMEGYEHVVRLVLQPA